MHFLKNQDANRVIAGAQVYLTFLLFVGIITIVILLELGVGKDLTEVETKMLSQSVRFLEDGAMVALGFWFQRLRTGGIPDGSTPTRKRKRKQ